MATIFWVEDQSHWIDRFTPVLEQADFDGGKNQVITFRFAEAARQKIAMMAPSQAPDVAILDAHMNGNDAAGFSVSRALHAKWPELPIIYLSEHSGTRTEQCALEQSSTRDFIAKHQDNIEAVLCWRIKAALRQKQAENAQHGEVVTSGELQVDLVTWEVFWRGKKLMNPTNPRRPLPPTPRKIIRYLAECSPRPLTTAQLVDFLEADPDKFSYASYRQHIKTLRHAFDQAEGGGGHFLQMCKLGRGIVTCGDQGAYCWKPEA